MTQAARDTGREGIIAPPPMLSTWLMVGYKAHTAAAAACRAGHPDGPAARAARRRRLQLGVVATNDEHEYAASCASATSCTMTTVIEDVSPRKQTALGHRPFHHDPAHLPRPERRGRGRPALPDPALRPVRRRARGSGRAPTRRCGPSRSSLRDNAFWFAAAAQRRLVIQACADCGTLRHPPARSARTATRSTGTRCRRPAAAPCTATSSATTRRRPGSTTRWPSCWSIWTRAPGWSPTSPATRRGRDRHARGGRLARLRRRA